jgi:excisionase family DNA binding protein
MASKLIPVEKVHETALGDNVSPWTVYRLIRQGQIRAVRVGRRVFLTEEAIDEFISRGGAAVIGGQGATMDAGDQVVELAAGHGRGDR